MTVVPDPFPQTVVEWANITMNENLRDVFTVLARMGYEFVEDDDQKINMDYVYITYDESAGTGKVDKLSPNFLPRPRPDAAAYPLP